MLGSVCVFNEFQQNVKQREMIARGVAGKQYFFDKRKKKIADKILQDKTGQFLVARKLCKKLKKSLCGNEKNVISGARLKGANLLRHPGKNVVFI